MSTEALRQGLADKVRAALGDALAEKLRNTKAELATAKIALASAEQRLADERSMRESAEAARDKAQADLIAALSRPPVIVEKLIDNPATERIEQMLLNWPKPEPMGDLVLEFKRGADDRITRAVMKGAG